MHKTKKCLLLVDKASTKQICFKKQCLREKGRKQRREAEIHVQYLEEIKSKGIEDKEKGLKSQTKRHWRILLFMYHTHCISEHDKNGQQSLRHYNSFSHPCMSYIVNVSLSKMTKTTIQKKNYLSSHPVLPPLIMWFCNQRLPHLKGFQKIFWSHGARSTMIFEVLLGSNDDTDVHLYQCIVPLYTIVFYVFTIMKKFRS